VREREKRVGKVCLGWGVRKCANKKGNVERKDGRWRR